MRRLLSLSRLTSIIFLASRARPETSDCDGGYDRQDDRHITLRDEYPQRSFKQAGLDVKLITIIKAMSSSKRR
jgi:hypothetical protein